MKPIPSNQNSQQNTEHEKSDLAGNYGGGSLADNQSGRELDRGGMNDFRQPVGPRQADQFGGERANRSAQLQHGANLADREGGVPDMRGHNVTLYIDGGMRETDEATGERRYTHDDWNASRDAAQDDTPLLRQQGGASGARQSADPGDWYAQQDRDAAIGRPGSPSGGRASEHAGDGQSMGGAPHSMQGGQNGGSRQSLQHGRNAGQPWSQGKRGGSQDGDALLRSGSRNAGYDSAQRAADGREPGQASRQERGGSLADDVHDAERDGQSTRGDSDGHRQ